MLTSAAFDFPARLPANVRYVGAQLDDPAWAEACALPGGDGPLVLVAMSSTFQDHADSLQRVADGLGRLPVRALLTTGPAVDPEVVRAPANVTVVRSAPHSQAMQQAAVVVTHGGHGTVVKSLAAGVPLVVMPHGRDQADNATARLDPRRRCHRQARHVAGADRECGTGGHRRSGLPATCGRARYDHPS